MTGWLAGRRRLRLNRRASGGGSAVLDQLESPPADHGQDRQQEAGDEERRAGADEGEQRWCDQRADPDRGDVEAFEEAEDAPEQLLRRGPLEQRVGGDLNEREADTDQRQRRQCELPGRCRCQRAAARRAAGRAGGCR